MKSYNLWLPVYKQGDDLATHLNSNEHPAKAFIGLAEQYKSAAEMCEVVANHIKDIKTIEICADTHHISLQTRSNKIQKLIDLKIVVEEEIFE